jgi:hypothetical protein
MFVTLDHIRSNTDKYVRLPYLIIMINDGVLYDSY